MFPHIVLFICCAKIIVKVFVVDKYKGCIMGIQVLDCTLRDGGYVNEWCFTERQARDTVVDLIDAGIEIIECGFLDQKTTSCGWTTRFSKLEDLDGFLFKIDKKNEKQMFVAMINFGEYNLDLLPNAKDTKIDGIRLAFHRHKMHEAFNEAKKIVDKGYKLFIQPMTTNSYSPEELELLFDQLKQIEVYAVYIVDTQGSMYGDNLARLIEIFCKNLKEHIHIGFHSHNNLQLSYANAIEFCSLLTRHGRGIIIDASIYGMGRGAGNLNTELFVDYLNKFYQGHYQIDKILSLIDRYYYAFYKEFGWGYSIFHYLSASFGCHPNYASFLFNKKHLLMQDIKKVLSLISDDKKNEFDKQYIEELYYSYNAKRNCETQMPLFDRNKKVLLLGSGKSLLTKIRDIQKNREQYIIIAMNYMPNELEVDYVFFTSIKRYEFFSKQICNNQLIFSSNIASENSKYLLDYSQYVQIDGLGYCDISIAMFINYLISIDLNSVYLAGVDGFNTDTMNENYCYEEKDYIADKQAIQKINQDLLYFFVWASKRIKISFITESAFQIYTT